jgi:hypothetical protein
MVKRLTLRILIIILVGIFIYIGLLRSEVIEVFRNSTLLCLSCIGIQ